ncbi:hypothetical protein [Sinobaca sp. H24]|uniref:hypothetical protein n=1 Tax=Sinobaca sp. H24 TaxID=2923376 RepID=UPI002079C7A8|nr:hypothetical protein [Sinobaca sp. H24]
MLLSSVIIGAVKITRRGIVSIIGLLAILMVAVTFSQVSNLYVLAGLAFFIGFFMTFVYIRSFPPFMKKLMGELWGV